MDKICIDCQHIGKANHFGEGATFFLFASFILGIATIPLGFWHPAFIILTYIFITISLLFLGSLFESWNMCPECKNTNLVPVNSLEAEPLTKNQDIHFNYYPNSLLDIANAYERLNNQKRKICTNCLHIGIGTTQEVCLMKFGLVLLVVSILTIPLALFHPLYLIGTGIYLLSAILLSLFCVSDSNICSKCKKNSMILLTNPKAKKIITENNIENVVATKLPNIPMISDSYGLILLLIVWSLTVFLLYKLYVFLGSL